MNKFNFKPGDKVELSNGEEHTFLIDRRTLASSNEISKKYPYLTISDCGFSFAFNEKGVNNTRKDLRLIPPVDWKYGFVCLDEGMVKSFTRATAADAIMSARSFVSRQTIPFRADFGRGVIEKLEGEDDV